jgi:hypothetical protein
MYLVVELYQSIAKIVKAPLGKVPLSHDAFTKEAYQKLFLQHREACCHACALQVKNKDWDFLKHYTCVE